MVTGFCISIETSGFDPEKPEKFEVTEVATGPWLQVLMLIFEAKLI